MIDGNAFDGEGLIESVEPGERRLVSYGTDAALLLRARSTPGPRRISRLRARDGFIVQETEDRDETMSAPAAASSLRTA